MSAAFRKAEKAVTNEHYGAVSATWLTGKQIWTTVPMTAVS